MTKERKDTIKQIIKRFEISGTNTVTSLYEFAVLDLYKGGSDKESVEKMLKTIGETIRRERYDRDVLWAAYNKLQRDNDRLRQLALFAGTGF